MIKRFIREIRKTWLRRAETGNLCPTSDDLWNEEEDRKEDQKEGQKGEEKANL